MDGGAEVSARRGWLGLRSQPRPAAIVTFGGSALPSWIGDSLREALGR